MGGNGPSIGGFHFRLAIEAVDKSQAIVAGLCKSGIWDILTFGDAPVALAFIARIGEIRSNVAVSVASVVDLCGDSLLPLSSSSFRSFSFYGETIEMENQYQVK